MSRTRTNKSRSPLRSAVAAVLVLCVLFAVALAGPLAAPAAAAEPIATPESIDAYLASKGSPMAGQGAAFVGSGGRWKVDPRLLVAIAGAESGFGKITCAPYNGWGWGCPNGPYAFTSWADAIETITRGLRTGYLAEGRTSVALIQQKYAPSQAANDPTGLNNHWVANVSQFLLEQGGNPNDIDLDGVAGSMPLGVEVDPSAPSFDFTPQQVIREQVERKEEKLDVRAGTASQVRIELRNTGSQVWTPSVVRLRRVDVESHIESAPFAALEDTVSPNGDASFVVDLRASGVSGRKLVTRWRLEGPAGPFGPELERTVDMIVPSLVLGTADVRAPEVLPPGTRSTVVVKLQNAGADTWRRDGEVGMLLGARLATGPTLLADGWISPQVPAALLEREVEPGEWGSFAFNVAMPQGAVEPAHVTLVPFSGEQWAEGDPAVLEVRPG